MKVSQAMTPEVRLTDPGQTIQEAARIMAEIDAGVVPVSENDKLVGMLTDRDIAIRAIARGQGPDTKVGDVMTRQVKYCFEDEEAEDVCRNMGDQQIRRIPVVNRDKRLVGILSLGDLAVSRDGGIAGQTLAAISQPGGGRPA
ncbi:CBS domain-containing protein [Stappia sp. F7233]|uniref:CBS domain-containing protein n=1 Tax=Stappia albiluteola TaxID=2758565 RepID=A0A839AFH5_9HYPH|nr:CBS domain-containing protein [Stappia albiluteola]MBA5777537.1 CBS domain-containing protein [Stappia albiluteola]